MEQSTAKISSRENQLKCLRQAATSRCLEKRRSRKQLRFSSNSKNLHSKRSLLGSESSVSDTSVPCFTPVKTITSGVRVGGNEAIFSLESCPKCVTLEDRSSSAGERTFETDLKDGSERSARPRRRDSLTLSDIDGDLASATGERTFEIGLKDGSERSARPRRRNSLTLSDVDSGLASVASSWASSSMLMDEDGFVGFSNSSTASFQNSQSELSDAPSQLSTSLPRYINFKSWSIDSSTQKLAELRDALHRNIKQELAVPP